MLINPTEILLWRVLAIFLLIGALLGVLLALLLIFKPHLIEPLNRVTNRWISARQMNRLLDRSFSIERWFYQHHRAVGMVAILGAAYILIYFGILFDRTHMPQRLSSLVPARLLASLVDALVLSMLAGGAAALMVGLFFWLRPSLLRGMEEEANQWVSSRRATKVFDVPHGHVDRFVVRHAQRIGWLLLLGSIYLFFILFRLLA